MSCVTHEKRDAVYQCDKCGAPICRQCYDDFALNEGEDDETHLCSECYKEAVRSEIAEVRSLKGMVIREFVFIIIGLIVGLILGLDICFGFGIIMDEPTGMFIAIIYLPFIVGSLLTICKKVYYKHQEARYNGDSSPWITPLFNIIIYLLIAPITTIGRFIQRIIDMVRLNRIMQADSAFLVRVDEYIAQSLQPTMVEAAAAGGVGADLGQEISLDDILGDSGVQIADNGEVLRQVRTR